jgi:alpha-D-ribose 1-methylphosphonate 5-phosphate C-P lyase
MIVLGCDFTSAPSATKPITVARCRLDGEVLVLDGVDRLASFEAFDGLLREPGPWLGGFDFPFGQTRRLVRELGWPENWSDLVSHIRDLGSRRFAEAVLAYERKQPDGAKQHKRAADLIAGGQPPQKVQWQPVGLMFAQGTPRLLASGIHIAGLRENGDSRVAVEVYPAITARLFIKRASYKSAEADDTKRRDARRRIVEGIRNPALTKCYGVRLELSEATAARLIADAPGDELDAVLCAVQAAWAARQSRYGVPPDIDALEGWISDPATFSTSASTRAPLYATEPARPPVEPGYNFAYLDEQTKRMIRRALLKAVAIPGYQVPFASRDMPLPYGWGTGGIQVTAACIGPSDVLKVIDQGADDTTNAVSIRRFFQRMTGVATTEATSEATLIQTRHRIPEEPLQAGQILVYQVPIPEPLRFLEPRETETRQMHALQEYGVMHVKLYEDIARMGRITTSYNYPVRVHGRYLMAPSPTPKFDNPKMSMNPALQLFGAGREKRIYAVPPFTEVVSLDFEDHLFEVQSWDRPCGLCGATDSYLDEVVVDDEGTRLFCCSDTDYCARRRAEGHTGDAADSAVAGATS